MEARRSIDCASAPAAAEMLNNPLLDPFDLIDHEIIRLPEDWEEVLLSHPEVRRAIPELPFRKMRGMRNIVAHDYANVNLKVVWEVATVHVPVVCAVLEKFFASQSQSPQPGERD